MNCNEFRNAVEAAIERREAPARELAAHAQQCRDEACQSCWDDAVLLDRVIADWRRVATSINVAETVARRCRNDMRDETVTVARTGNQAAPTAVPIFMVGRALAALVATALVLTVVFWLPSTQVPNDRVAIRNGAPRPANAPERTGDAGAAYVAYAQSAAQIMTDAVVLTLGDSDEMEDATIAPGDIRWDAPWPQVGETMDSVLDEWLEAIPVDAPPS